MLERLLQRITKLLIFIETRRNHIIQSVLEIEQLLNHGFIFLWIDDDRTTTLFDIRVKRRAKFHQSVLDPREELVQKRQIGETIFFEQPVETFLKDVVNVLTEQLLLHGVDQLVLCA